MAELTKAREAAVHLLRVAAVLLLPAAPRQEADLPRAAEYHSESCSEKLFGTEESDTILIIDARQGRASELKDCHFGEIEDSTTLFEMAAEGTFFGAGKRDVNMRLAGCDDSARVQDFEWPFYRFECVDGLEGGRGDVMVGATLNGAGTDHDVAILDVLLPDHVEDGFEQEGIAIEEDAVDSLHLSGLEDFGRRSGVGLGRCGGGLHQQG